MKEYRSLNSIQEQTKNGSFDNEHSFPRIYHVAIGNIF